jgi:hypothetical protein
MAGKSKTPVRCGLPRKRVIGGELFSVGMGVEVGTGTDVATGEEAQDVIMNTIQPVRIILTEPANPSIANLFVMRVISSINKLFERGKRPNQCITSQSQKQHT